MNPRYKMLLSILHAQLEYKPNHAMSAKDIYDSLEPSEKGIIPGGIDGISKTLCAIRNKKWLENGPSSYVNNQSILTYQITPDGVKALNNQIGADQLDIIEADKPEHSEQPEQPTDTDFADGLTCLSPADAIDAIIIPFLQAIKTSLNRPSAPTIFKKREKIESLQSLKNLLCTDFCVVLDQICEDLEKFESSEP